MMIEEVYDALKDAGASDEKARAAARAIASYDTQLTKISNDTALLKWMVGVNTALVITVLFKVFT